MEKNQKNKKKSKIKLFTDTTYFDYPTLFIIIFLIGFGLMMIFSTSSYRAYSEMGDSAFYFKRQLFFAVIGIVTMLFISKINYKFLLACNKIFMVITIILLFYVLILGSASGGAVRWIQIGPMRFQPSEVAKLTLILYMADMCTKHEKNMYRLQNVTKILAVPIICVLMIAKENLSTAIVCAIIVCSILFVISPRLWYFILIGIVGVLGVVASIAFTGYRGGRIEYWLHPEDNPAGAYQSIQSLYAIGSGGLFGRGLGQSIQKLGYIPESHTDMIFSVICEELGVFGALCIILVFTMLLWRFKFLADNTSNRAASLILTGIIAHIAIQVIINISVATNTIPNTGIPLPFISYGGTSISILLGEMGIALGISRQIKPKQRI